MAGKVLKFLTVDSVCKIQVRYRYPTRGVPPHRARNLKQRLAELHYKDPELYFKVNIGFAPNPVRSSDLRNTWMKEIQKRRKDPELELKTLRNQYSIDLEEARKISQTTNGPQFLRKIAEHFGIFGHLYGDAYFYPVVPMNIDYDIDTDYLARVFQGNLIKPCEAKNQPQVHYEAESESLWTLLMTTPDGNFSDPQLEYCHWFISNIPGNEVTKGEQIIDYLRPIPAKGIGFCRYIFVLYKQEKKMDFSEYKKESPCLNLVDRNWKTYDFYRKHQEFLTPAGLAFFQSDYDTSLKDFYHKTLEMKEPTFEYDFPKPYYKRQTWFPKKEAFNLYLDRYRDPKQINKEFLLKKLKKEHPFKFPDPPLKYPNVHSIPYGTPSWYKTEIIKERLGWGRINEYK